MLIFVYFGAILLIYYSGSIFTYHSLAIYLAAEDIMADSPELSRFSRNYLSEAAANPRVSFQMTMVIKSSAMILASFLAILSAQELIRTSRYNATLTFMMSLLVVWIFHLFFMEYMPRQRPLRHASKSIRKYLPLFALLHYILRPFLRLYDRIFLHHPEEVSEEQKEDIVERAIETLADQAGVGEPIVEKEEKEMIGQIFQLDVTEVREIMVPRIDIIGLSKNMKVADIRELTADVGFSRYPVFEDNLDKIIGILYIKDLFTRLPVPIDESSFEIGRFIRPVHFIPESKKIRALLSEFKANRVHMAIVVDEYGGTSGLVTMEDILEEIVGDIQDEHDYEEADMVKMPDNSLMVDAGTAVEELVEALGLDYETGEFETVGGLIYDLVGSVPTVGTDLRWKDILFEVAKVEGQRIISVKARVKKDRELN
jgi:putative hemolysin